MASTPSQGFWRVGRAAIIVAAGVLIALAWLGARDAILAHRGEARARVEAELLRKALSVEEQLRRELLTIDQTLRILEYEWQRDPQNFDFSARAGQVVALNDVSLQLFITDARGVVRSSSRPALLGNNIAERDYFRHHAELPNDDDKTFIGALKQGQFTQLWQMNLARRLDRSDGTFAGVIVASYDMNSFARFYREIDLGSRGIIGVVSPKEGTMWTLSGSTQSDSVVDITNSPIFAAMNQTPEGHWIGTSAFDSVERIHAFGTVPDRDLKVVVGIDRKEAMQASVAWEQGALAFAGGITLLILLMAGVLLREERAVRLRHEVLAHERAILEATLTGMTDGIMMVDADLRLLAWNQRFPEFTGVPVEMLRVGLPMENMLRAQAEAGEFGSVEVESEVTRRMALLRSGGSTGTIERQRPGGRILEIRRNPLPGGGFVTLYADVTLRHETEERLRQAQMMAAIGRLTSGVAHDFNNLLASISGNAEMLQEQIGEQSAYARRISIILQAAGRGADLVRQLLAFSRKQTLAPVQVDLNKVVNGIDDLLRATLGKTISVKRDLAEDLWLALVDPVQVEHVILNLVINARDAMPDGGLLTITTTNASLGRLEGSKDLTAGEYVVVSVTDTGTGMTDEVLRNAFEPFFTTKPPGQGSGLGLSQVYGVATQSGGGVQIDSVVGEGTTVRVFFPRASAITGSSGAQGGSATQRPTAQAV